MLMIKYDFRVLVASFFGKSIKEIFGKSVYVYTTLLIIYHALRVET